MSVEKVYTHKIRNLKQSDRVTVTNILRKAIAGGERYDKMISSNVSSSKAESTEENTGMIIAQIVTDALKKAIDILDTDVRDWFADLIGVSVEDFGNLPFTIELDIIEQIRALPEAEDFFMRCWRAANGIEWLRTLFATAKRTFNTFFEALQKPSEKPSIETSLSSEKGSSKKG